MASLAAHPDSRGWVPPNGPHSAFYARLRISKVFAFVRPESDHGREALATADHLSRRFQDGFGDVAYIGWLPLELYKAAGGLMRSEKECHRSWPEPIQPEPELAVGNELFAESSKGLNEKEPRLLVQL